MGNANPDAETIRSTLAFAGGVLSFSAVVIGIINAKLQRAKTGAAKERVISRAFGVAAAGFPLIGIVLFCGFGMERALLWFFCLGTVFASLRYLCTTAPPRREETLVLVAYWCGATLMVIFHLLGKVLAIISNITSALRP